MGTGEDCDQEKWWVTSLPMTFRVVGFQGSTRSSLEQEGEGNKGKSFDQRFWLIMISGFQTMLWNAGRWQMGQNQGMWRVWVMTGEFGLLCRPVRDRDKQHDEWVLMTPRYWGWGYECCRGRKDENLGSPPWSLLPMKVLEFSCSWTTK